jgi:hypothetical protein
MNITGIGIDYSNICKDYNTAYLDRDNKDPDTSRCMQQVLEWSAGFLSELAETFGLQFHLLNTAMPVKVDEIASKRFLFYSLEKEITLQSFVAQKTCTQYDSLAAWADDEGKGILIQNDEDGEGIYLFLTGDSPEHTWIKQRLEAFSLDEVPFSLK